MQGACACWSKPAGLAAVGTSALSCGAGLASTRARWPRTLTGAQLLHCTARSRLLGPRAFKVSASAAAVPPQAFHWTPAKAALSVFLFVAAALAEIGGGWLIWQAVKGRWAQPKQQLLKNRKALTSIAAGSCCLVGYGFIPTAQPSPAFGRLYAVYGGFFVLLSYAWGWVVDGDKPDKGDWIGASIAIAGVALAWFWPR